MPQNEYDPRSLSLPISPHSPNSDISSRASSPFWSQPSTFRRGASQPHHSRTGSSANSLRSPLVHRWRKQADKYGRHALHTYSSLSRLQQIGIIIALVGAFIGGILLLIYNERIFGAISDLAKKWKGVRGGWVILWILTFIVSFPPLLGYSTLLSLAGFVYGFPGGWPIVASATLAGSTTSFLTCRHLLSGPVSRLTARDARFAALTQTIQHDGLKLLVMIRLCPLPYSLSNGALSGIPSVTPANFVIATAAVTPKLLVHIFVGSKLAELADRDEEMDTRTKLISYLSIVIGSVAGVATGWIIYRQTQKRARELEEQEAAAAVGAGGVGGGVGAEGRNSRGAVGGRPASYADDPASAEAGDYFREDPDDISLRGQDEWADEGDESDAREFTYRDSPSPLPGYDDEEGKSP